MTIAYAPTMSHQYHFRRGDRVKIISGKYAGATGTVDSKVLQRSADYPEELGAAYHVVLGDGRVVTVRVEQVGVGFLLFARVQSTNVR